MSRWVLRLLGGAAAAAVFLCVLLSSRDAMAFPWLIREGYNTCNTCHADPSGAGILTQYGRGMEEVVVRTPYKGKVDDPGTLGNFAFGVKLPEQLLLQTDYRSLIYINGTSSSGYATPRYILMQADQAAQLKVGRFRLNGSIGYNRDSGALAASVTNQPADWGAIIARQYWMGFDIGKDEEFLLRIGRMNKPFGIRSIEHTLWARVATRSDINADQEHGVTLAYTGEHFRGEAMAIAGNYQIHGTTNWDGPHERGYSAYLEWLAGEKAGLGVSSQITHADEARTDLVGKELNPAIQPGPVWRQSHGLFARVAPVTALVFLAEADFLLNSQLDASNVAHNHFGAVGYVQADLQVFQGIHIVGTGEYYNPSFDQVSTSVGGWLGVWWFFAPHFDFRFDWVQQSVGGAAARTDVTSFLFQLHGYL